MAIRHRLIAELYDIPVRRQNLPTLHTGFAFSATDLAYNSLCSTPPTRAAVIHARMRRDPTFYDAHTSTDGNVGAILVPLCICT